MKLPKLPSGVSIHQDGSGDRKYWVLRLGKRWTGGETRRRTFPAASGALAAWEEEKTKRKERGEGGYEISSAQLAEAQAALAVAKELGTTLTAIVQYYRRTARPAKGTITYDEAIADAESQMLRESASEDTMRSLRARWRHFRRWLVAAKKSNALRAISTITSVDIREYVMSGTVSQLTRVHMRDELSSLFRWAKEEGRIADNPCRGIAIRIPKNTKPVTILTPGQSERLLSVCQSGCVEGVGGKQIIVAPLEALPIIVVGLYAGLRPKESTRLDWSEIREDKIDIASAKTKKSARRIIPMAENMRALISLCRKESGPVVPTNWRRKFRAIAAAAGLNPWPQDCLRHSYASYHYALHQNMGETMAYLGHHDTATFIKHYYEAIKNEADIKKFWGVAPQTK